MSACIETDSIFPRNAPSVTIENANVVPVITSVTFSSTSGATATAILYTQNVGKVVEISIPMMTIVAASSAIVGPTTLSSLTAPATSTYWSCLYYNTSTPTTPAAGSIYLDTSNNLSIRSSASGSTFTTGTYVLYPHVLRYPSA